MKNDCCVVKDLIPLYAEGLVSTETKEFIYEHCQCCQKCKELLQAIADSPDKEETTDNKKEKMWTAIASKERKKKKGMYVILSFAAIILITSAVLLYIFLPKGNNWSTQYDYTYTEQTLTQTKFTENDIYAAASAVEQEINVSGSILLRLSYNEKYTLNKDWHSEYPDAIIFEGDYYLPEEPVAGDPNRLRTHWSWWVVKDSKGKWEIVNSGHG